MAWRRAQGIGDDEVVVGFLSRLVMEKGLDVFSDALDELRRHGVRFRVLIVGEGPAREWLENRLPDAVFTGFLGGDALATAVAGMDVLLFPSAMACGVPVVAAAATGSESLVDDRVTGRLIRPGAVHQFAEAVRGYVADAELRAKHGAAGEARSLEFSWDRINQTVADTQIRLIRQKAAKR
jgi:phosphatidylinositol alpha 1,6-mannosyltransferase